MNLHESIKKYLNESNNQPAYVICYGTLEIWPDRDSAREYYEEGVAMCEGAEQQRYGNIAFSLYKGNNFGDDEGPEMVTKIIDKNTDGSDKSVRINCGRMTHEQAFDYITKLQNAGLHESDAPQNYERGNAPFESKRVPEDRIREEGYLYFSTHGTGPGASPKDVRVREMDWDLPSGWVAIKTDRPLTSEELSWYDIQPETKNNYYRQRFHLSEATINESAELPELPENLIKYLDTYKGMDEFPTVEKDGTKWFSVSQAEYDSLKDYVDKVDSIPEDVWRTWDDKKKLDISNFANNAERVCRNCIIKEAEEIKFKDDKEAKLFDFLHNNIYFEEKDVKRNGLGKLLIDLKDLSDEDFNKVAEFIKGKPEYILNKNNKKICIMGNRKDNKLDEAHVAPFNDRLDNTMLDAFANHYYKYQEQPHKWTKKEMRDWIIDNKKDNPDTKIDLVHLNNLLDFQHDLYDMDMEDLNESDIERQQYRIEGISILDKPDVSIIMENPNKLILCTKYFHQYTEGITGQERIVNVYMADYDWTREDIKNFMRVEGIKKYSRKGKPSPYGNVGEESLDVYIMKGNKFEEFKNHCKTYHYSIRYYLVQNRGIADLEDYDKWERDHFEDIKQAYLKKYNEPDLFKSTSTKWHDVAVELYKMDRNDLHESESYDSFWNDNLTLSKYRVEISQDKNNRPVVNFYTYDEDAYKVEDIINSSYFIAKYYLDTLLEEPGDGLNLGNNYIIDGYDWQEVLSFLNSKKDSMVNESESPEELVVETCDMEQTGGWVWVGYGKLTNGKYYVLFSEGLNLYDADIHKYEYEEDHYDEVDGYYGDYEDAHRIASYDFTSPEYKSVLKQCVKLNDYAEYLLDDDEREEFAAEERRETLYKQIDNLYKESEGEDVYENPDYSVDVRDLTLTNGGYHNNADMIYGRIIVKGKTKNAKDVGAYDIMYIPENNHLSVFMPGFDVQGLSDIIYAFYEPNDWITFGNTRMQYKDITEDFDNTFASDMVKIDPRTKEAIVNTIDNAYYNEKPIPLNTRKYQ